MSPKSSKSGVKNLHWETKNGVDYFSYHHPAALAKNNGKPIRLKPGTTLQEAKAKALQANAVNDRKQVLLANPEQLFSHLIKRYRTEYLPAKGLAKGTLANINNALNRLDKDLGDKATKMLTVKHIADYLDQNHFNNAYVKHRGSLIDLFLFAINKGLADSNPAMQTFAHSTRKNDPKQRERLDDEGYKAIYDHAPQWLQNALDIALITLQARTELSLMRFDHIQDGLLKVVRQKTGEHIKIEIGSHLESVLRRCRDDLASPFVIHRRPEKKRIDGKENWTQVLPDYISKAFKKARDASGYYDDLEPNQKPGIHEVRSYGADRYLKAGYSKEYVNALLGHAEIKTTDIYLDGHEPNWTEAKAEIEL